MNHNASLKIISINILHLKNRLERIQNVFKDDYDIICIQETCLKQCDAFYFPGYKIVRRDILESEKSGGVCILARNKISFTVNDWFKATSLQALSIKVNTTTGSNIDVITMYQNCHQDLESTIFDIATQNSNKFILVGDLNSPHTAFGSSYTHQRGETLLDFLLSYNLFLFNSEEPTFYHRATGNPNILDLAIGTTNLANHGSFSIGEDVGSDHLPIVINIGLKIDNNSPEYSRNMKNINWDFFQARLSKHFSKTSNKTPDTIEELNISIRNILETFEMALNETAPLKKTGKPKWWTFTKEIKEKVKLRRKLRRIQKKNPTIENSKNYNRINKDVRDLIRHQKQQDWQNLSEDLNTNDPKKAWQTVKKVLNSSKGTTKIQTLNNNNGASATTDLEKADLMAEHLEQKQTLPTDDYFDQSFRKRVDSHIADNILLYTPNTTETAEEHVLNDDVTPEELERLLSKCNSSSSPGSDHISYKMLKAMPIEMKQFICTIFSLCLLWGYFPAIFKSASIKMIPKPKKDSSFVKNYRPISLLSCAGKLLERVISSRLLTYLIEQNLISKYQCGFLPNKSTAEHIYRLSQDIYTSFKKQEYTLAIFLDIDGAFDRVWLNGLKYKLTDYGLPRNYIRVLSSFVNDRSFTIKEGISTSKLIFPEAGTPQGSVLSPLLFILYTNDFPIPASNSITFSQYADDIAIWSSGKNLPHMQNKLQLYLNEIEAWCKKWLVQINADKTQLTCFHRKKKASHVSLSLKNVNIGLTPESTFLGITFDSRLNWKPHLEKVHGTFFRKCNILRSMSGQTWGAKQQYMIRLYKAWALPNIEYGCLAFLAVSDASLARIQVIQNKIIRAAYRLPRDTPRTILHEISSLDTIKEHIRIVAFRTYQRISSSDLVKHSVVKYLQVDHRKIHNSPLDVLRAYFNVEFTYM